ncbi:hypothetical protein V5O48_008692 [Marasmius crinis-equi]|uniref:Uncharacterized protein n=1 Tax=Marasmius crinis-equi TaxID=585013 RepID=A0ABR3FD76_9AGAR
MCLVIWLVLQSKIEYADLALQRLGKFSSKSRYWLPLTATLHPVGDGQHTAAPTWDLHLDRVYMSMENSVHFAYNTDLGANEWNATLPSGSGRLLLGPPDEETPQTISLFHQLRCLDIIRHSIMAFRDVETRQAPEKVAHHCMNYLRQMVGPSAGQICTLNLCGATLDLE